MSMTGQHIIQQSTLLRGQGFYSEAIATIEENIDDISKELHPTAWHEAAFAAEAMHSKVLTKIYSDRAARADKDITDLSLFQRRAPKKIGSGLYTV